MERDPFARISHAPLLPKQYCVAERYIVADREHRLVVDRNQNYRVESRLRQRLENKGFILRLAGFEHPSGSIEFVIPEGVTSLSAFLNSTSADQHKDWKRGYMFNRIKTLLQEFTMQGIGLEAIEGAATRYNLGQNDMSDPVLLPATPISIKQMDTSQAETSNKRFYTQIQQDIIEVAPPDERDFPF